METQQLITQFERIIKSGLTFDDGQTQALTRLFQALKDEGDNTDFLAVEDALGQFYKHQQIEKLYDAFTDCAIDFILPIDDRRAQVSLRLAPLLIESKHPLPNTIGNEYLDELFELLVGAHERDRFIVCSQLLRLDDIESGPTGTRDHIESLVNNTPISTKSSYDSQGYQLRFLPVFSFFYEDEAPVDFMQNIHSAEVLANQYSISIEDLDKPELEPLLKQYQQIAQIMQKALNAEQISIYTFCNTVRAAAYGYYGLKAHAYARQISQYYHDNAIERLKVEDRDEDIRLNVMLGASYTKETIVIQKQNGHTLMSEQSLERTYEAFHHIIQQQMASINETNH